MEVELADSKAIEGENTMKVEVKGSPSANKEDIGDQDTNKLNEEKNNSPNNNVTAARQRSSLGKLILDVDKGFLKDEKDFQGTGNDNIQDKDILMRAEEEIKLMHPYKKLGKFIINIL